MSENPNPICSCSHHLYSHNSDAVAGCQVAMCKCTAFNRDTGKHAYFEPANHIGHMDTCRNCGKAKSFHGGDGTCRSKNDIPRYIDRKDGQLIVKIIGRYQTYLEGAIESALPPGSKEVRDPDLFDAVALDRKHWREAEDLLMRLTDNNRKRKVQP